MQKLLILSSLLFLASSIYAQKQVDMLFPFLQGAMSEVFTDRSVLVEGESAELEVQIAKENLDIFKYDGIKAYDCQWALQEGEGTFTKSTGGKTTFKTPASLSKATEVATITASLTPTSAAQAAAQRAGFTFPKVILYIRIQEVKKDQTALSFNDEVFIVQMKSSIQSPENMLAYYQQKYAGSLSPEQVAQFEAANAKIAADKAQGQAKASAAGGDINALSMNQLALLKDGILVIKINTGGSYFNLGTGLLETSRDVHYTFTVDKATGAGTYNFPSTKGSISVGPMTCACAPDEHGTIKCVEGTSASLVIEEMGTKAGELVKGTVHATISDGLDNYAKVDGHFVAVLGNQ